jgi:hypothetical protein
MPWLPQVDPLGNRVLFARSAFDPGLTDAIARVDGSPRLTLSSATLRGPTARRKNRRTGPLARGAREDEEDEEGDETARPKMC